MCDEDIEDPSSVVAACSDAEYAEDTAVDETDAVDESDVAGDDAAFVEVLAELVVADELPVEKQDNREMLDTSPRSYLAGNAVVVQPCAGRHHQSHQLALTDVTHPYFLSFLVDY